jgi:hypothetical protein
MAGTIVRVSNGEVTLVKAFERLPVPAARASAGPSDMGAVPTGSVVRPDGSSLVAFLTGFPFPSRASKMVEVAPDGSVSDYATGLTMTTDLERGPDGRLCAVEFATFGPHGPEPDTGDLVRITDQGPEVVVDHLPFPTAVGFTPAGDALVALGGIGEPASGHVSKYRGVAVP